MRGLISFGQFAESEMRRCLARSMDEDQIRNAHRVLAALGDRHSKRAATAYCWADLEEEEAAAKKQGAAGKSTKNDANAV